ncbi:MAG: KUP/HAK/KT family potassium transporter [Bacteroidota bacterium]
MSQNHHGDINKVTFGGLLVTLGIIFGDIGTSPLYVMSAINGDGKIEPAVVLGGMSLVFWTLTLQTTIKYVLFTLQADNKGEGGIFALYTLIKKARVKWLIFPAIIGGCCILGEGIITPPISVASAVEGLKGIDPSFNDYRKTVPIIILIITLLFVIQQFGTKFIGKAFGPIMLVWFLMLGFFGIINLSQDLSVFKALNPIWGIDLLIDHPGGFWLLGAVFLCTTGAEALYSDMGHCGRQNIRMSWIFVKIMLVLNYFGQSAWLLSKGVVGTSLNGRNPFYEIMPQWFLPIGICIATAATIVASQALISGSFTLINEAMRLNFWPKFRIKYPTELKGQMYIPAINWMLYFGCIFIVLFFKESKEMEAAYGLTIILGMMMSSRLLPVFMKLRHFPFVFVYIFIAVYFVVESSFLVANLKKFINGGYITLLIAIFLACIMGIWYLAKLIRGNYTEFVKIDKYKSLFADLSNDLTIPKYATHLIHMTNSPKADEIESKVIYSILQRRPKRADLYWFVHVNVMDEPNTCEYRVHHIQKENLIRIDFNLGFKVAPKINLMFRKVVQDLVRNGEVDITSRYESLNRNNVIGDFKFIIIDKFLSYDNDLPWHERIILDAYFFLKRIGISEARAFGLDPSSVRLEKFPLVIHPHTDLKLQRISNEGAELDFHEHQFD